VKVLTYNIHGWLAPDGEPNLDAVADLIAATGADLVGLNEVFHPHPTGAGAALDRLAERLGLHYAFGPTVAANPQPSAPAYGNALLSRGPILAYAAHHLAPMVDYGQRGLLEARVLLPTGRAFTVYVTHLDHRIEDLRLQQWAAAVTWLGRDRARPHLLLGDFNALSAADFADPGALGGIQTVQAERGWAPPSFKLMAQVSKAGYADAFTEAGSGARDTWPADRPDRRIDYILFPVAWSGGLRACRVWDQPPALTASDHRPVLAEFAAPEA